MRPGFLCYNFLMIKRATIILVTIFMALVSATPVFAESTIDDSIDSSTLRGSFTRDFKTYDYIIDDYDINVNVAEDNSLRIVEKIKVFFTNQHHGIIRKIPIVNHFDRDGKTTTARAKIRDISVDDKFTESREGENYHIKIGDPNVLVDGEQSYTISYTYNMGRDTLKDLDDLYLNIVGTQWEVPISHVRFSLTMPKEFDSEKVYFYSGALKSTRNLHVNYKVSGQTITGENTQVLAPGEAVTVRILLPDGYFVYIPPYQQEPLSLLLYIIPIAAVVFSWILWAIYGNDKFDFAAPSSYPPEELSCPEIGIIMKGSVSTDDVMAMLFSLANRGYIRIVDNPQTSSDFNVVRMKNYDGNNELERQFMDGLFANAITNKERLGFSAEDAETGMEIKDGGEAMVTSKKLQKSFYKTVQKIIKKSQEYRSRYYEANTTVPRVLAVFAALACGATAAAAVKISGSLEFGELAAIAFPAAIYLVFICSIMSLRGAARVIGMFIVLMHATILLGAMWVAMSVDVLTIEPYYLYAIVLDLLSAILCIIAAVYMSKRNSLGERYYSHIRAFQDNLKQTASGRLHDMAAVDMRYAYDILPYAFMFGLTAKWMKKFSDVIKTQPPEWYSSDHDSFDMRHFNNIVRYGVSSVSHSPYSSSGGSSSGGSSGGGSSGGGGGGGGGSAW